MELHPPGQLNAVPAVADVLLRYLARLPLSGERRALLFADAFAHGATVARALARVHAALASHAATAANAAHATIGARLRLAVGAARSAGRRSRTTCRAASGWRRRPGSREARWRRTDGSAAASGVRGAGHPTGRDAPPASTSTRRRERRAIPAAAGAITLRDGVCCSRC